MTEIQKLHGPFAHAPSGFLAGQTHVLTCGVTDRLSMIRTATDKEWLLAVIKDRDTQMTVRQYADRRLRKLRREAR